MKIDISFAEFKKGTGYDGKENRRGPNLKIIDAVFADYDQRFEKASAKDQLELTQNLFIVCKEWLQKKKDKDKSTFKKGFFNDAVNKNLAARRKWIGDVALQCLNALAWFDPKLLPETLFDAKKIAALAQGKDRPKTTPLAGGYANERKSFEKTGKKDAIAASDITDSFGPDALDKLSLKDFLKKAKVAEAGLVKYIKKDERYPSMCVADASGLFCRPVDDSLVDCGVAVAPKHEGMFAAYSHTDAPNRVFPYAMDSYGNLFACKRMGREELYEEGYSKFNHSSLNAGREVISAGMAMFCHGQLRWIDNNSGHYKPSADALRTALLMLANDLIDLSDTCVGVFTPQNKGKKAKMQVWTAEAFLKGEKNPNVGVIEA